MKRSIVFIAVALGAMLMWSAQSETVNPGPIDNFVKTYPAVLIGQLVKDGVLKL